MPRKRKSLGSRIPRTGVDQRLRGRRVGSRMPVSSAKAFHENARLKRIGNEALDEAVAAHKTTEQRIGSELKMARLRAGQQDILGKHKMLLGVRKIIGRVTRFGGKAGVAGDVVNMARAINTGRAVAASRAEGPRAGRGRGRDFGLFRPKPKGKR